MKRIITLLIVIALSFSVLLVGAFSTNASQNISIKKTTIVADSVANTDGYGSLIKNSSDDLTPPQTALIDARGQMLFPYKTTWNVYYYYDGVVSLVNSPYKHNYIEQRNGEKTSDIQGFYRLDGTVIYEGSFGASIFRDGYAIVVESNDDLTSVQTFLIDQTGRKVFAFPSDYNKVIFKTDDGTEKNIRTEREATGCGNGLILCGISSTDYDEFLTSISGPTRRFESCYYIDSNGKTVINSDGVSGSSDSWVVGEFWCGYAKLTRDSKVGFINQKGEVVIPFSYDSAGRFEEGLVYAEKNGKYGIINADNQIVVPFEYENSYGAAGGLASMMKNGKWGLVDYNNNVVVPFEYDDISPLIDGVAYAIKDRTVYIITDYQPSIGDGIPTFHAMVLNGATGDDEHGTDNAAALMYTSLCKNQLDNYVVENQNIHPFAYNNTTNPTSEETVNKWISHSFSSSDDDDLSVFYYTGHSTWDGNTSIHFGITLGNGEWYRWSSLAQYLAEHVKGQIIVILDTCFSETFTTVGINSLEQKDKDRFSVITSCAYDEKSSIRNVTLFHELNYPCFSYSIGEGIGFVDDKWHADVNSDGKVTLEELYNYVSKKVRSYNDDMHVTLLTNHKEQVVFQKAIKRISFSDVDNQAYYWDAVSWAVNKGITNGTSDTTFSPNQPCTRAQVVTFLWRANGSPKMTGGNPFKDVTTSAYYYDAVQWAAKNGITAGTSATTFSPNQACTRAQVVTFLWRAHGQPVSNMKNPFLDVKKGQFYYDAVLWAVSNDVTKGTSQTLFSPDQTCTRGQIVTFLYRDLV